MSDDLIEGIGFRPTQKVISEFNRIHLGRCKWAVAYNSSCFRNATVRITGRPLCTQHAKMAQRKASRAT